MSLLRGKSVTYTRFAQEPVTPLGDLDTAAGFRVFEPLGGPATEPLESIGTVSWRNILDGPIDRGFLPSQSAWVVGVRRDVKRAPGALVQAELAREISDLAQVSGGAPSKKAMKEIRERVTMDLSRQASPKPSLGLLAFMDDPKIVLWDGPTAALDWASTYLAPLTPFYQADDYDFFLSWLIENAGKEDQTYALLGDLTMKNQDGKGIDFYGMDIVEQYTELLSAGYTPRKLGLVLPIGDVNADLSLSSSNLKVHGLKFPELEAGMGIEERLEARIEFVAEVERRIAELVTAWLATNEE